MHRFVVKSLLSKAVGSAVVRQLPSRALQTTSIACGQSPLWKVGKINHVAIAVPDVNKAASFYKDVLGANVSAKVPQPEHGVYTVFVELGDTKVELLEPYGDKSPIQAFLNKNKAGGMHHICIEVSDIKKAIEQVKSNKIRTLGAEPKIGAHGKPVMFLHPKDCNGVLVELEEE